MSLLSRRVFAILLVLCFGGCANATVADRPMRVAGKPAGQSVDTRPKSYAGLVSSFDRGLTEAERKAVISSLQKDGERAQQAALGAN
jgi:hypothetical protein